MLTWPSNIFRKECIELDKLYHPAISSNKNQIEAYNLFLGVTSHPYNLHSRTDPGTTKQENGARLALLNPAYGRAAMLHSTGRVKGCADASVSSRCPLPGTAQAVRFQLTRLVCSPLALCSAGFRGDTDLNPISRNPLRGIFSLETSGSGFSNARHVGASLPPPDSCSLLLTCGSECCSTTKLQQDK